MHWAACIQASSPVHGIQDSVGGTMHGRGLSGGWPPAPGWCWTSLCPLPRKARGSLPFFHDKVAMWKIPFAHHPRQLPPSPTHQLLKASCLPRFPPLNPTVTLPCPAHSRQR